MVCKINTIRQSPNPDFWTVSGRILCWTWLILELWIISYSSAYLWPRSQDKIIWRQTLAPLKVAVKFPSSLLNLPFAAQQWQHLFWTGAPGQHLTITNPKSPPTQTYRPGRHHTEPPPPSDNLRESLLHNPGLGKKCKLLILEATIIHQVGNKKLPPKIYISMKAEKVANSLLFVSSPGLSMGHVLWITVLSRILHLASCILLLLFVLGCENHYCKQFKNTCWKIVNALVIQCHFQAPWEFRFAQLIRIWPFPWFFFILRSSQDEISPVGVAVFPSQIRQRAMAALCRDNFHPSPQHGRPRGLDRHPVHS